MILTRPFTNHLRRAGPGETGAVDTLLWRAMEPNASHVVSEPDAPILGSLLRTACRR